MKKEGTVAQWVCYKLTNFIPQMSQRQTLRSFRVRWTVLHHSEWKGTALIGCCYGLLSSHWPGKVSNLLNWGWRDVMKGELSGMLVFSRLGALSYKDFERPVFWPEL